VINFKVLVTTVILSVSAIMPVSVIADNNIAVVDLARAIFGSDVAQARLKQAEQSMSFVSLKAKYESSVADLQALAKEAENKRLTWSPEQQTEHQKKIEYAKADTELAGRKIQSEQQQLQQDILQELGSLAQQALQEVVKEEGIDMLFPAESVMVVSQKYNLTPKVAERLNQKTAENTEK
jgi:outer membrane protein